MNSYVQRLGQKLHNAYRLINGEKMVACAMIIETEVGLKPINQIIKSYYIDDTITSVRTDIKLEECIGGGPDFLKDQYTLIGKSVYEMPHYELIRYLDQGLTLADCPYIKRALHGTLDFRKKPNVNKERLTRIYKQRLMMLEKGECLVVRLYSIDENTFVIADGKHTSAMAAYFKYPNMKYEVIPSQFFDTYYRWIYESIANHKDFQKHHTFFRKAYDYRRNQISLVRSRNFSSNDRCWK